MPTEEKDEVWQEAEDKILKEAVRQHGSQQWNRVATLLPRKTVSQCKARWYQLTDSNHYQTTTNATTPIPDTEDAESKLRPSPSSNTTSLLERLRGNPTHWIHLLVALLWWRLMRGAATKRYRLQSMFTLMSTVLPSELSLGSVGILHFTIVWMTYRSLRDVYRPARRQVESSSSSSSSSSPTTLAVSNVGWSQVYPAITMAAGVNALSTASWAKMAYYLGMSNRDIISQLEASSVPAVHARMTSFARSLLSSCFPVMGFKLPSDVSCTRDIPYWKPRQSSAPLKLDIYSTRKKHLRNAPVFMYIHGGGWIVGDKRYASRDLLHRLAQEGWIVVSIQYRLTPKVSWPFHLLDCKRALLWIKKYITEYGGDPNKTAVGGDSAGGHLAAMVALTANDTSLQSGYIETDTSVCACVDIYGIMDLTDSHFLYRAKDPSHGMRKLSQNVLRKKFPKERPEFVKASPFWLAQGSVAVAKELFASVENEDIDSLNRCAKIGAIEKEKYKELLTLLRQKKEKRLEEPSSSYGLVPPTGVDPDAMQGSARPSLQKATSSQENNENGYQADVFDYEPSRVPPFLMVHGMYDTLVPAEDSLLFWNALQLRRKRDKDAWLAYQNDELNLAEQILLQDCKDPGIDRLKPERTDPSKNSGKPLEVWGYIDVGSKTPQSSFPIKCRSFEPNRVQDSLILLDATHHAFNYSPSFRTRSVSNAVVDYLNHVVAHDVSDKVAKL